MATKLSPQGQRQLERMIRRDRQAAAWAARRRFWAHQALLEAARDTIVEEDLRNEWTEAGMELRSFRF